MTKQTTVTNLSKPKSIRLIDLFFGYPYKKNIQGSENTTPIPYVKKEDIIYNEYTMDYTQWKLVITRYLELLTECLIEGNQVKLPNRMGILQIMRYKTYRFFDRVKSKEHGKQVFKSKNDCENYMFYIEWLRKNKEAMFNYKWHWRLKPNRRLLKLLYEKAEKDYTFINKFKIRL